MANNRIIFEGLAELKDALRTLPSTLTVEGSHIVDATANAAAVEMRGEYGKHNQTGDLQDGVIVTHEDHGKYAAGAIVKNTAKHAFMAENGTQARHTGQGWNRGAMPPMHIFVPVAARRRRGMYATLKDMLVRNGLTVTGDA